MKTKIKVSALWWMAALVIFLAAGGAPVPAAELTLPEIEPPPDTQPFSTVDLQPEIMADYGYVQAIHPDAFVIGDRLFEISAATVMRSRENGPATVMAAFKIGDFVGYRLDDDVALTEIWLEPDSGR